MTSRFDILEFGVLRRRFDRIDRERRNGSRIAEGSNAFLGQILARVEQPPRRRCRCRLGRRVRDGCGRLIHIAQPDLRFGLGFARGVFDGIIFAIACISERGDAPRDRQAEKQAEQGSEGR